MLAIDITPTQNQYMNRGIGVSAAAIITQFIKHTPNELVLIGFDAPTTLAIPVSLPYISLGKLRSSTAFSIYTYKHLLAKALQQAYVTYHIDAYLSLFMHSGIVYNESFATSVYVHDVIQKHTNVYSIKSPLHNLIRKIQYNRDWRHLHKAKHLFTNSNVSKEDIEASLHLKDIVIAPLAVDHAVYNTKDVSPILDTPYLLTYGGDEANKNVEYMIDTFALFAKTHPDYHFVILGKGYERYKQYVQDKSIANILFTGFVSDEEKVRYIHHATCFLHLSLYEGFGLSVMENMACGTPCVITEIPIYKELFAGDALFVATHASPIEAACILETCINNTDRRNDLIAHGIAKAAQYQWEYTYQIMADTISS